MKRRMDMLFYHGKGEEEYADGGKENWAMD